MSPTALAAVVHLSAPESPPPAQLPEPVVLDARFARATRTSELGMVLAAIAAPVFWTGVGLAGWTDHTAEGVTVAVLSAPVVLVSAPLAAGGATRARTLAIEQGLTPRGHGARDSWLLFGATVALWTLGSATGDAAPVFWYGGIPLWEAAVWSAGRQHAAHRDALGARVSVLPMRVEDGGGLRVVVH